MVLDDEDMEKMGNSIFMGVIEDQDDNRVDELDPLLYGPVVNDGDVLFDDERK